LSWFYTPPLSSRSVAQDQWMGFVDCSFFPVLSVMRFFASVLCFQVVAVDLQVIGFVHGESGKCRSSV